jgi:hypothetical protein
VRRLVSELETHYDDLVEELRSLGLSSVESERQASLRLGTEETLAESILARPELRSWARRRPWLAFAVLPFLCLPLQFVLAMWIAAQIIYFAIHHLGFTALHPGPVPWICSGLQAYALWIAPMLAAGFASVFAARQRAPLLWPVVASIVIAGVGAMTNAGFDWSPAVPHGVLSAGIGFPPRNPAQWLRIGLTLLMGVTPFLWLRSRYRGMSRGVLPQGA